MKGPHWTPSRVSDALERAADTLSRLPGDYPDTIRSCMPAPLRDARDVWVNAREAGRHEDMTARLDPPTAADISELDIVLTWTIGLDRDTKFVLWGRAYYEPWKILSMKLRRSRTTAWRIWFAGLSDIADRLNSGVLECYLPPSDREGSGPPSASAATTASTSSPQATDNRR